MIDALNVIGVRRFFLMEADRAHFFVVGSGMVLCEIVGMVESPWFPEDLELALFDTVADPVKPHVHCFGSFGFDCVI